MPIAHTSRPSLPQSAVAADFDRALQLDQWRDAAAIARLQAEVEAQATLIREQAEALAHSRKIFDRASAAARIGVWECNLADEALTWTDQVYDMFDVDRNTPLDRRKTIKCYTPASRKQLEDLRSRAIAERSSFQLDAEIMTPKGNRRWIRVTATVECEDGIPTRIFGMKQDITEEKILADRTRYLAEFDIMTGLANRSTFQTRLATLAERESAATRFSALLLVDLDGFKQINDLFGHALGDECLKEAAMRLNTVCREADLVARIGGDEFAVLLHTDHDQTAIATIAQQIVDALGQPMMKSDRSLKIGASVGIAAIHGETLNTIKPSDLFTKADAALYAAKAAGRNTFRLFSPDMMVIDHACAQQPAAANMAKPDRRRFRRATPA